MPSLFICAMVRESEVVLLIRRLKILLKTKRQAFFSPPIQALSVSRACVQIDGVIISAVMPLITHVKVTAGRYGTCCATRCQVIIRDD